MNRFTKIIMAVLATVFSISVYAVSINGDAIWLDAKDSDANTIQLRDMDIGGTKYKIKFDWNPATNMWVPVGGATEKLNPVLPRVEFITRFDAETSVADEGLLVRAWGRKLSSATFNNTTLGLITPFFRKVEGTQREFGIVNFGLPDTLANLIALDPLFSYSIKNDGITYTDNIDATGTTLLADISGVSINEASGNISVSWSAVASATHYQVKLHSLNLDTDMFVRNTSSTSMIINNAPLFTGENYEVRIWAYKKVSEMLGVWSRYHSSHRQFNTLVP